MMIFFENYTQSAYCQVLVPAKVLEELCKYLLTNLTLPDKQWRDINCKSKSPLWKFQKVLTIALQMSVQVASKTFIFPKVSFADINHPFDIWLLFESFYFQHRIVEKQYFLGREVISIKFITCQVHTHVHVGFFGLYVGFFSI